MANGFDNDTMYALNVDFRGVSPVVGQVTANGQLLIGSTVSPNIRVGNLTSTGGTVAITNGAGSINLEANTSPFNPNNTVRDFDDFIAGTSNTTKLFPSPIVQWDFQPGTATNPGQIKIASGASGNGFIIYGQGSPSADPFVLGGGQISMNFVFDIGALSNNTDNYTCYIGLMGSTTSAAGIAPTDGIYFKYNHAVNGGRWQIVTTNSSVSTTANSGILAATGFHNYGFVVNAGATSVSFYINGVLTANSPLSGNIPSAAISPTIISVPSAGNMPDQFADLFYYEQILTTAR